MIVQYLRAAALAASLCLGISAASAQGITPIGTVELTHSSATAALQAMPDMYDVATKYEGRGDRATGKLMEGLQNSLLYQQAKGELDAVSQSHGFSDYFDWVIVVQNLYSSYAYLQVQDQMAEMGPAMQQMLQQLENNPDIPAAQKEMLRQQMGGIAGLGSMPKPSDNNLAIAQEFGPQIEAISDRLQ